MKQKSIMVTVTLTGLSTLLVKYAINAIFNMYAKQEVCIAVLKRVSGVLQFQLTD